MARLREAIGGAVLPARIASSAALFQSVTTSALAGCAKTRRKIYGGDEE